MAAKAVATTRFDLSPEAPEGAEDLYFFSMPLSTHRLISDAAKERGLSFSGALHQALEQWLNTASVPKKSGP